ncbi:hypothetical protein NDU88_001534 [Pleurodeles waltl]|uniref:Uncharacterized protein n=1 Tax=Pleurodeles waltl TaxID=8319 RepID=A0AAV7M1F1_PLEWA|nr:hypothetical protein NDU88_001534 [Pleurodeles waltl]
MREVPERGICLPTKDRTHPIASTYLPTPLQGNRRDGFTPIDSLRGGASEVFVAAVPTEPCDWLTKNISRPYNRALPSLANRPRPCTGKDNQLLHRNIPPPAPEGVAQPHLSRCS